MALATQIAPTIIVGPDGERPDPATVAQIGTHFKPLGLPRLDVLEENNSVRSWSPISGLSFLSILTNPVFYVDPTTGNNSNAGTISAPFATLDHALQRLAPGWFGFPTINLRGGTHTIGSKTVFPVPLGNTNAAAGSLLINGVDNADSGLGARTASGGTTGTLPTFGTVVDSSGGLTTNAWEGWFIRFTSGDTLNGRSFQIASNSANTFTTVGTIPVAPTTETFVVERPAATITWAGTQVMQGLTPVGVQNVSFVGPGGGNSLRLSGFVLGVQRVTFASLGSGGIALRNGAGLTDLTAIQGYLGTTSITQQCGAYLNGVPISLSLSSTSGLVPSGLNLNRALLRNSSTDVFGRITFQFISSYHVGGSWVRAAYGAELLMSGSRFNACTPATPNSAISGAYGAAIVFSQHAGGLISQTNISDTPATVGAGDAILIEDNSLAAVTTTTGTGNAGVGCRVRRLSQTQRNLGTSITGAGGEVKIGAEAVTTWTPGLDGVITDPVELCIGGPVSV